MIALKAVAVWVVFVVLAILNGAAREHFLVPAIGEHIAHPLSGILLSLVIFAVTLVMLPIFGRLQGKSYLMLGTVWLAMTLAFEFIFGRYVAGRSWSELLVAYDLRSGNLWLMVLVITLLSPYAAAKLRSYA